MFKIICGNDYDEVQKKLVETTTMPCKGVLNVACIINSLYQKTLVGCSKGYVVRYDEDFVNKASEEDWQRVKDACADNTLILIYGVLDKRSRFYKFFKSDIIECNIQSKQPVSFVFVDNVLLRDKLAIDIVQDIQSTDVIGVLSMLYNRFRIVLQIQATPKGVNVCDNTGLDSKMYYWNKKFTGQYSDDEIINCMRWIDYITDYIKRGIIEPKCALKYLLVNIL